MFRSGLKDNDQEASVKTQALEPIIIPLPVSQQSLSLTLNGVNEKVTMQTIKKIRQKGRAFPLSVAFRCVILVLLGILLFYFFIILVAVTLFNLVLALIFFVLMLKYFRWGIKTIIDLRNTKNIKQIKQFLQEQNQRYYSAKLIRFQLVQAQKCIKILNLKFQY